MQMVYRVPHAHSATHQRAAEATRQGAECTRKRDANDRITASAAQGSLRVCREWTKGWVTVTGYVRRSVPCIIPIPTISSVMTLTSVKRERPYPREPLTAVPKELLVSNLGSQLTIALDHIPNPVSLSTNALLRSVEDVIYDTYDHFCQGDLAAREPPSISHANSNLLEIVVEDLCLTCIE